LGKEILIVMDEQENHIQKSKKELLIQGVEKLKIIGFENVTILNILTDDIYQLYFLSFLKNRSNPISKDEIIAIKELKLFVTRLREV
jgi:hypothetical protein